jgi:SAM-dependent methyltransferase
LADWDERYRRGHHATLEPSRLLRLVVARLAPGRALDLACGAGRHAILLAEHGWEVAAVDASSVAVELVRSRARTRGLEIDAHIADLERGEFRIEKESYDLVCVFYYLQRDLFPQIRAGVRDGGAVVAAIHVVDEDPASRLSNPAFSLEPGELRAEFKGWQVEHYREGRPDDDHKRASAEIFAVKRTGIG